MVLLNFSVLASEGLRISASTSALRGFRFAPSRAVRERQWLPTALIQVIRILVLMPERPFCKVVNGALVSGNMSGTMRQLEFTRA